MIDFYPGLSSSRSLTVAVCFQGDSADCMYFIEDGEVVIRMRQKVCFLNLQLFVPLHGHLPGFPHILDFFFFFSSMGQF